MERCASPAYVFTRDRRKIMRCVREPAFDEIYVNRASGESRNGYRMSGGAGEDGPHGIEGFIRRKTIFDNFG